MKKSFIFICLLALCSVRLAAQTFTLGSSDLGGQFTMSFIANSFGCNGSNQSPELHWHNAPKDTKSFAVTMYDMDAPTGSGFWHWVIVDIPASASQLKRGAGDGALLPAGSQQQINDTGKIGYQGPCPGAGDSAHRYLITLYALGVQKLGTSAQATPALSGYMLNKAAIAKASLLVYCKR